MIFINDKIKVATFGNTHEKEVGVIIEGFPIDFEVDFDDVQRMLDRRRPGSSEIVSQRNEEDVPNVTSGISNNKTTGDIIRVVFENKDIKNSNQDKDYVPRPGHGDFTYFKNTGKFLKGATSARSTVGLVFAGSLAKQYLAKRGIFVSTKLLGPSEEEIKEAMKEGDSIGGLVECNIIGLEAGFGNPYGAKLESVISSCVFNIPGIKGLEFGTGFESLKYKGSELNDAFIVDSGKVRTETNNCGGVLGGLATGSPVVFRTAFKPAASIKKPQKSVNLMTLETVSVISENRNDPCIAVRGAVVVEAAAAIAILDICLNTDY